jgi:RNA polymerase sigma factor (sigma-70 family)
MGDMHTSQVSDNHRMQELERVVPQAQNVPNLFQLFSLDLRRCPRFDRTAEYALACQTHAAWRHLVHSLEVQHDHLVRLLGPHLLPSSYNTISESDIVHLLYLLQVRVDLTKIPQFSPAIASTRDWLAQMRADLADFRRYRDEMVRRNLRFVVLLARRHPQSPVRFLDLVQEGALGLMRAVEKFDPNRGIRFASYAVWWIREAFARTVTSRDDTMCFPDATPGEENEGAFVDRIATPEETTPEAHVLNVDSATHLYRALTHLPEPEADILRLRFGLGEPHAYTLAEVSRRLGLTREQVRVREQRALVRLRVYLQRPTTATLQHRQEPQRRWRKAIGKRT